MHRYAARLGGSVALMTAVWDEHILERARKRLGKRAKKGFRGYPIATITLYGPDDTTATKLTVGIVPAENANVADRTPRLRIDDAPKVSID